MNKPLPCVGLIFRISTVCLLSLSAGWAGPAESVISLIPQPVHLERTQGVYRITSSTTVMASRSARKEADRLIDALAPAMGFRLKRTETDPSTDGAIVLALDVSLKNRLGPEGYTLNVTTKRIDLRAAAPAGLLYGIQTLRQLLPVAVFSAKRVEGVEWNVPCLRITDHPRFAWRGLLIDPARHFIPVEDVKHFIDAMALHKLNRLQMHLTDNEGWRIEIKKYPNLTELGSKRDRSGGPGGYYTQDDIREIVSYAQDRHITIVPEIEMPYHAGAAIVAYPRLGIDATHLADLPPDQRWGQTKGLIAPRPETVAFLKDVLADVIELFPGKFIHIGGDEANVKLWADDPEMQTLMKRLNCKDAHALHSWFIRQMDTFLAKHGRRMVGWDEILQGGLAPGATVMSWRGEDGGIAAAQAGHDVVMAPTSHTYFDYYQGPREKEPRAIGGHIPLEKVYRYEPIPAALNEAQARHVLGAQAQLWGEYIVTPAHRDYMAWPRSTAFSEVVWSPNTGRDGRDVTAFMDRLEHHLKRLAVLGVNYRPLDKPVFPVSNKTDPHAPRAVRDLVQRLLPDRAGDFTFEIISPARGRDVFEIEAHGGKVVIRGNNGVAMAMGLNWYLKHYCHCDVSWCGNNLNVPDPLPTVRPKVRRTSWARYRYFLNYCCFGYSLPWWDWAQWERLIDWMALNGINAPLAVTGQEAVWRAVGKQLEFTDQQIQAFLAGPPYLPFGWMGCLDGWGGPLPKSWIDRHEELGKRILARERALGMTPVLQGFTGHVPAAMATKFPDAKLQSVHWIEWQTHLLDPLDPLFPKIAKIFLEEQTKRFGTDHLYAADTFIEMRPPSGDLNYLQALSRAIYDGMAQSDPQAVWVLQTWIFLNQQTFWTQDRIRAFLNAVPNERMLCLDLFCENKPQWSRTEAFYGKPWVWCNVQNFGRTVYLGGALNVNSDGLTAARRSPKSGQLVGLGFVNEGLGYNPVAYDLMFEMAWRDEPVDLNQWVKAYAHHRYGRSNADAEAAWAILKDTVYTAPHRTRSVIDTVPTLKPAREATYDNAQVAGAWRHLLRASKELGSVDTYRFDLVNIARQVLSNHAADLQRMVIEAQRSGNAKAFRTAADNFLQLLRDLDELLATRPEFLLGHCLEDAKRWGTTDAERDTFEWNARRVLTLWGTGKAIRDYARKEWSGMIGGFYLKRWEWYLRELAEALENKHPFDDKTFHRKLMEWERQWADLHETYLAEPRGDSVAVAQRLWTKYGEAFKPDAPSLTTGKPTACSTSLPPYPARLANDGYAGNTDRYWAMDAGKDEPAWWRVDLEKRTTISRVVVVGYFGDDRHYGFIIETSLDGSTWDMAADRRDNTEPSTAKGYTCRFKPRSVRYIRVTLTNNSANTGRHLVEVMAFAQ